ncbi:MAG TPA: GyrI-like domain-containing protein [Bryobacteraceae bacterium]|jgi:AraC family transcriptional regulator|nr:GyrI-like domain-containing protein [Bryobacteraceae bacterium]
MTASTSKARLVNQPALLIAGLRGHFSSSDPTGIPAQWQRLAPHLGSIPGQVGRVAYGVCLATSPGFDYISGVEVREGGSLPDGFQAVEIPAQRYAVFAHEEHVSQLFETISKIWSTDLAAAGYRYRQPLPGGVSFFERYGEGFDPLTGRGDMEIWVPVE